jgi:hypothetical protein
MIDNQNRISRFTSSQIYRLCSSVKNGDPTSAFYSYIEEKIYEKALGRSIETGVYSQSMAWGKFLEKRVNDNLGMEYSLISKTTFVHPKYPFWSGSPDFVVHGLKVAELKCYEPKNFASYGTALLSSDTEIIKEKHPKEYWQIISNAIIQGVGIGEALLYMPYESEMEEIRSLSENPDYLQQIGMSPWEVRFITEKTNSQLAVLPDDSKFPNLIRFEFDIPQKDAEFLTKRVLMASKILNNGV